MCLLQGTNIRCRARLWLSCYLPSGSSSVINQELVLYTDNDVMFYHKFNPCKLKKPDVMAVGPEVGDDAKNSGVLFINIKGLADVLPNMMSYAKSKNWEFPANDQGLIDEYFPTHEKNHRELDPLPPAYNWKGYWGFHPSAIIVHWHGPKPDRCIRCYIDQLEQFKADSDALLQCQCPFYDHLWKMAMVADEGKMYMRLLRDYKAYHEGV